MNDKMNKEDPKDAPTTDKSNPEVKSRRGFLKGGAAAVVGAIAAAATPAGAEVYCTGCSPPLPSETDGLAKMLVNAWKDPGYRDNLLTFVEGKPTDWGRYNAQYRINSYARIKKYFDAVGVKVDFPVVLSEKQFQALPYWKFDETERVFQLLDPPIFHDKVKDTSLEVDVALYAIKVHVCGM
jgi:hypothetical protein